MADLIKRLEEATEGSRELDCEIGMAIETVKCEPMKEYHGFYAHRETRKQMGQHTIVKDKTAVFPPHYTTNLQDALGLVPDGWCGNVDFGVGEAQEAMLWNPQTNQETDARTATPALALCVASLKAIEARS